eukprot:COSAG04_NODE_5499_length_1595_cov_3.180481_2_plen_74_part_00
MPNKKGGTLLKGVKRAKDAAKGSAEEFVARRTEPRHKGVFVMPEEFERAKWYFWAFLPKMTLRPVRIGHFVLS